MVMVLPNVQNSGLEGPFLESVTIDGVEVDTVGAGHEGKTIVADILERRLNVFPGDSIDKNM